MDLQHPAAVIEIPGRSRPGQSLEVLANMRQSRWEPADKSGTSFVSYRPALETLCRNLPLRSILEFGPGFSTSLFLEQSSASITSVETRLKWYLWCRLRFRSGRLHLLYRRRGLDLRTHWPKDGVSLVFVDGGDRVSILKSVAHLLDCRGIVFLHDAHREDYEAGIRLYPYRYFPERHSCILLKSRELQTLVERLVPSDYSCCCRYCSSETRRAYFRKLNGGR